MQGGRPISFMSKILSQKNQAMSVYEREFLVVLMVVQKRRNFLLGHRFIIRTDQKSLKYLLDQKAMSPIQQKWITKLLGPGYDIEYRKGTKNRTVVALSRVQETEKECVSITTITPLWIQEVIASYNGDSHCSKILSDLEGNHLSHPGYTVVSGLLRYKGRVVVGANSDFRVNILVAMYSSSYGGHSGVTGTYMRLKSLLFWPKMKDDVISFVKKCDICKLNKPNSGPMPGLLQPLPIPEQAWTHISMDFVEGLPNSMGKNVILVIVDRLTKYGYFLALSHPYIAQGTAKLFLDHIYKLHGLPVSILTDRDKIFTSSFWRELFKALGYS